MIEARRRVAEGQAALDAPGPLSERANTLHRAFHTLKGMSAQMGVEPIALLAHALEDVCEALQKGGVAHAEDLRGLLMEGFEAIGQQVRAVEEGVDPLPAAELEERVRAQLRSSASTDFRLLDVPAPEVEEEPSGPGADPALAAVAEILAACTRLGELAGGGPAQSQVQRIERAARALYARLAEARQVTFGTIVPALRRQIRVVGAAAGKEVALDVLGEDVRVDPDILMALQGALAHLLSNAVMHGIEDREARRAAAKPRVGQILLTVQRTGERLVMSLSDDGRGFDLDALREAACRRDADVDDAIALARLAGVSTMRGVARHAGRGQGLGAAWYLVESVGGTIEAETVPGAGARFRLEVPALSQLEELTLIEASGQLLAVPARHLADAGFDPDAPPLLGLPVDGPTAITVRGGRRYRVDRVVGTVQALVSTPPFPLNLLPRVSGTTVAPDGRILFVVQPAGTDSREEARCKPS